MTTVCMIVAATKEGIIGNGNALPWRIKEDLAYFKAKTLGYPVIMGRKTYESIGGPLPERYNVVLTRSQEPIEGVSLIHTPVIPFVNTTKVFIIGGSEVYKAYEDRIDEIYLTEVGLTVEGDARLPFPIEAPTWILQSAEYKQSSKGVSLCFQHWMRNKE